MSNFPQLPVQQQQQQRSTSPATSNPSPIDSAPATSTRSAFSLSGPGLSAAAKMSAARSGAGSPSHDLGGSSRLYSKRAREIQAQEGMPGMSVNLWAGPPTSGNSTPLRENIPESPTDGFPDFVQLPSVTEDLSFPGSLSGGRRARAGTVPSRFSPGGAGIGFLGIPAPAAASKTSRPTPAQTPFKSPSPGLDGVSADAASSAAAAGLPSGGPASSSTLLSRLRAGSMPQRSPFAQGPPPTSMSPFGPSIFSSWNPTTRDRGATLASIASVGSNGPSSPAQSAFSREGQGESDVHMRTLDYLGLAETPQPPRATLATPYIPNLADFARSASRFRSYSVNNKDKYADEDDDADYEADLLNLESQYAAALQDQLAATNAAIHNHNLAVQAFASQAARPRAQTAGVLDAPGSRMMRGFFPGPSRLDSSLAANDIQRPEDKDFDDSLPQAVAAMSLGRANSHSNGNHTGGNNGNAGSTVAGNMNMNGLNNLAGINGMNGMSNLNGINGLNSLAGINGGPAGTGGLLSTDEPGLEGPTSALWLGSIPTSTTTSTLTEMFKSYGPILSARVLTLKNCGFVNFERVESAMAAKASLNGKEIFPGAGPVRINFAKPPSSSNTPGHDGAFPSPSPDPFAAADAKLSATSHGPPSGGGGAAMTAGTNSAALGVAGTGSGSTAGGSGSGAGGGAATLDAASSTGAAAGGMAPLLSAPVPLAEITTDILRNVKRFGASDEDVHRISANLKQAVQFTAFVDEIPPIAEPSSTRMYDAPKLRDIRKRIDNQSLSQPEIERIAADMLPEIAELASDYLGNTVVQKLFEHCSDELRDAMLAKIAPHLAEIGVHKNGTWAAQKIIDVCKTPQQLGVIVEHIRPYTLPLFLDQYGNYVLQGCLKFGAPYNDYIFETMLSRLWDIAQGRFGARAMRACLESHHSTKDQQRMLAAAIALNSVQLATNANGALLLTWLLDTCTFPQRRAVLAPQLVPYLVHLCTHKVAYLTVLKVVNQKAEPEARDIILQALFAPANDQVLELILRDSACGSTLIYKVITTPFFEESVRSQVIETVKTMLIRIKAQPSQGYKRLMDEVGLSTRSAGGGGGGSSRDHSASNEKRPVSRQTNNSHQHHQSHPNHQNHQNHQSHGQQQPSQQTQQQPPLPTQQQRTSPHGGNGAFGGAPAPSSYDAGFGAPPRGENGMGGVEAGLPPPSFLPYNGHPSMYGVAAQPMPALSMQQLQYQQSLLAARGGNPGPNGGGGGFYPGPMPAGYGGFAAAAAAGGPGAPPALEPYRNAGPSPANGAGAAGQPLMGAGGGQPAPFMPAGYGMGPGFNYGGGGAVPVPPYMPAAEAMGAGPTGGGGGRRGRTGRNPHRDASPRHFQ